MDLAHTILSCILALLLLATGGAKLVGSGFSIEIRDALGVPALLWKAIGMCELAAVVGLISGLWVSALGAAAAVGVALLMCGAIAARFRSGLPKTSEIAVDVSVLVMAVATIVTGVA